MADELPPIKSRLIIDDSQVAEVMDQVGKKGQAMGHSMAKGAEAGRLGMWSMGEQAENLAQSLGVPNQMSRQLGNSVERLAAGLGTAGVAFGIAGLAAMAAYAVWNKLATEKKKAHEELEKNVDSLLKEEGAMMKNMVSTQGLREANERLREVKQRVLDLDMAKWVKQEREEIEKLTVKIVEMKDRGYTGLIAPIMNYIFAQQIAKKNEEDAQNLIGERDRKEAELARKQEERKAQRINMIYELDAAEKARYYDYQAIINKSIEDDMRRAAMAEQQAQREMMARQMVAQNFASTFQMMASIGGKHARQWFTMYKLAAISEAIISTYMGATKALAQGGIWGIPWAASIIAMGMAKVAVIRAQEFQGSGGAGGGATGTFAANPATGLPAGNGTGTAVNLIVNINGQETQIEGITTGVLQTLYNNNNSMGGFTVQVERSA